MNPIHRSCSIPTRKPRGRSGRVFGLARNLALFAFPILLAVSGQAAPMGTAFTYQGRLTDGTGPADGTYEFRFQLYDSATGGLLVGSPSTVLKAPVVVSGGLFTVINDFGSATFDGNARWLEMAVRTNGGVTYSILSPRQPLTPAPYALFAPVAGTAGSVPWTALTGVPAGVGVSGWGLTGNSGTTGANFLGTTDDRALELKVKNQRALRLEPGIVSPNLIGGLRHNAVTAGVSGATIAGGGVSGFGVGTSEVPNQVTDDFGTVGGGDSNTAGNHSGTTSDATYATVGGGQFNTASAYYATVPGGSGNTAAGENSFAAGSGAIAFHHGSFVWADVSSASPLSSTAPNQFILRAAGGVGIGTTTPRAALDVVDGTGAAGDGGRIHVGGVGYNGDPKLIAFGDGDYVHIGENGADDTMELKAARFVFVGGEVKLSVLTITGGADLAEPFQMSGGAITKGAVVIIDETNPGRLKLSDRAYDTRVAGIVSGANGIKPGIMLHQEGAIEGGENVALSGRVYALADAANGSIQPGDLLTTSPVPGHAMKVTDHTKAQGAILGKAMSSLLDGRGMVLVLVSLQ
jgi:hypothetical protein